jgi:hypothetical protein
VGILKALKYFLSDVNRAQCTGHHRVTNQFKKDEEGCTWVLPMCTECHREVGPAQVVVT